MNQKLLLLLATGCALGLNFPLGKLAGAAGIDPLVWALLIASLPGSVLLLVNGVADRSAWNLRQLLPFAGVSGLLAYVIPNALTFSAIPQIGSGLASLMFALSPVTTATLSGLLGVRPPNRAMQAGIALGFLGALVIILSRNTISFPGDGRWLYIALVIPVSLALGNVHRTACWPAGVAPLRLAAASNLCAAPLLAGLTLALRGHIDVQPMLDNLHLVAAQIAVSLAMFAFFFRLQWVGGPTYLSQIGYVSAAVGLAAGTLLLGETYPWGVWAGAGLVVAGIVVATFWPVRA
jgi:drug/metabolite transporter (DMT)-like permease